MSNDHKCLTALTEKWERPFYKPVTFDRKTGEMSANMWAVQMFNLTPSGGMSTKKTGWLLFDYCPICGKRLTARTKTGVPA